MITITLKRNDCIGCGNCLDIAPEYWKMDEKDGLATLVGSEQKKEFYVLQLEDYAEVENLYAAKACPMNIIKVNKQIF